MAKGGARARSGPAPDPNALKRDRDEGEWKLLPADGRIGDPPAWPLDEPTDRELGIWATEWARPQAIVWERNGQELEVALYVRSLIDAERHGAPVNSRTLVKQLQESLGISVPGLLRNRWKIVDDVPAEDMSAAPVAPSSVRDRFKVVAGGGG